MRNIQMGHDKLPGGPKVSRKGRKLLKPVAGLVSLRMIYSVIRMQSGCRVDGGVSTELVA